MARVPYIVLRFRSSITRPSHWRKHASSKPLKAGYALQQVYVLQLFGKLLSDVVNSFRSSWDASIRAVSCDTRLAPAATVSTVLVRTRHLPGVEQKPGHIPNHFFCARRMESGVLEVSLLVSYA